MKSQDDFAEYTGKVRQSGFDFNKHTLMLHLGPNQTFLNCVNPIEPLLEDSVSSFFEICVQI